MAARRIGRSWWVDFRFDGARYRKRSPENTAAGARAFETTLRRRVARGELVSPSRRDAARSSETLFAHFAKEWFAKYAVPNNKPSEQRFKRYALNHHLIPRFGSMALNDVNAARIEELKADLRTRGMSPKGVNNILAVLRRCLRSAAEWGNLEMVPRIVPLKAPTPPFRFLSETEVEALVRAAPGRCWSTMVLVAARTGLRFSELAGLRWEDVLDGMRAKIWVQRALVEGQLGTPKSGKTRCVPLTLDARDALSRLRSSHTGFVFTWRKRRLTYAAARWHLHRACDAAHVPRLGWHVLRHTFASELARRGAPTSVIRDLLGHSTVKMTERYAHLGPDTLDHAIQLLEGSGRGQLAVNPQLEPPWGTGLRPAPIMPYTAKTSENATVRVA